MSQHGSDRTICRLCVCKCSRLKAELEASQSRAQWAEKELDTKVNELREERRRAINLQVGRQKASIHQASSLHTQCVVARTCKNGVMVLIGAFYIQIDLQGKLDRAEKVSHGPSNSSLYSAPLQHTSSLSLMSHTLFFVCPLPCPPERLGAAVARVVAAGHGQGPRHPSRAAHP